MGRRVLWREEQHCSAHRTRDGRSPRSLLCTDRRSGGEGGGAEWSAKCTQGEVLWEVIGGGGGEARAEGKQRRRVGGCALQQQGPPSPHHPDSL
eukprot:2121298-Rhodomonas_salina.1